MTPTAEELWNDADFIEERLSQQINVIAKYKAKKFYSKEREKEVIDSAIVIMQRFYYRLKQLNDPRFGAYQRFLHSSYGMSHKNFFLPSTSPGDGIGFVPGDEQTKSDERPGNY